MKKVQMLKFKAENFNRTPSVKISEVDIMSFDEVIDKTESSCCSIKF